MVFAVPLRQIINDEATPAHIPGLVKTTLDALTLQNTCF